MGNPGATAPARLGRYELLARLATGGMGEIFLARLEGAAGFEKLFVVKRILPHLADDARFRQMLIAEAQISSKMSHSNICQVYELGETDGQLYIVMEYMEGVTMLPLLRRSSKEQTPLDFGFIGGVVQQVSDALHYAHELKDRLGENLGIVHRDVTPSNIFLTETGMAKVLDFGIAKVKDASTNTQTGTVKGKYAYMSPEQLRGASIDRRADVFALGVVVYEMLALRRLFQRKTDYLTFRAVMEQPIPDVRRYRPDMTDELAFVLARALDRDPETRFPTARAFGSALLDALVPIKRPWSQGDISDFVRSNFATALAKRSTQVANAIHRTNPAGTVGRATMPLLVHPDEHTDPDIDDADDDEFPAVDSTISDAPLVARPQTPTDFQGGTPPPFEPVSSTASGPSLQPIQQARSGSPAPQLIVAAPPRRNLVWPLIAVAMVGIAGAALFLVWKQTQQQPQGGTVVIERSDRPPDPATDPDPDPDPGAGSAKTTPPDPTPPVRPGSGSATRPPRPPNPPNKAGAYNEVLRALKPQLHRCLQTHGVPTESPRVAITIGTNGKTKAVALEPAALNGTPLGTCIKNVLSVAAFPTAKEEREVKVTLNPKVSPG